MTRMSFPKESLNRSSAILDLVHSDLCGPMQTATPGGKKYFLTFVDDYSRYTTVYLLSHKSEALASFDKYLKIRSNKFGKTVNVLKTDRGGEYINKSFHDLTNRLGIQVQLTAPYTPQQNGVAERRNRHIMEMARCMLDDAGLENKYWGEAVNTAIFFQNRLPTKHIKETPYELSHGCEPIYENIKPFGCRCFVKIPDQQRRKLDPKAEEGILLGYDLQSKVYRCYVKDRRKVTRRHILRLYGSNKQQVYLTKQHYDFNSGATINRRK